MERENWDKPEPEKIYEEYELEIHERKSLKHIQEQLTQGHTDIRVLRDHINFLEALNKRVYEYLRNEEDMGYVNDTLKHDYKRIQELRQRLVKELDRLDA